jgi:succinate dehydrogenase / fumarate reductase, membrane anchor subunit
MHTQPFARPRPAGSFERYAWLFTRVSAVVLLAMALFHLLYMHIVMGVEAVSFQLIAWRWQNPVWRVFDLFLLIFGWLHGANGMRIVVDDYVRPKGWRVATQVLLALVTFVLIGLGAYVIFTFKAS